MSLIKCENTDKNQFTMEFSVDHATFEAAVTKVFQKRSKSIQVPGFRKGKAPRAIIERMYGKGVFYEDAINEILPDAYDEALKESKLDTVGQPEFDIKTIDDNGVVMTAKVYVKPEVSIENYKGIEAVKTVAPVTDEEVNSEINTVRERNSRETEITDRAVEDGDTVKIDYEGSVNGVAFDGGKDSGYKLKIGSGTFIPGFEDQIVGHSIGDVFDVNVSFPEDYHAKDLAGKPAVFKVKIHAISKVELPSLDDDFAKDVSEFDTLADYTNDVRSKIQKRHDNMADKEFEEKVLDQLIEKLNADIPEVMFTAETENFVRDFDNKLRMQGLDLNTYFKYTGLNLDAMRQQMRPQAERQVKVRLALEKIAALENIVPSDEEIEEEYKNIAAMYGMEADKVKEMVAREAITEDMKVKKAMDLVKETAVPVAEKKTRKKSTTKKAKTEKEEGKEPEA